MAKLHALSASEKVLVEAVAGAIGGFAGAVAFYPVDTIKTRIQARVGDGTSGARRKTMTEVFRELVANEGYGALFAGVGAKGAHSMASSFLFFLAFSTMRAGAEKRSDKKIGVAANLAIAALAGCINVLVTEPLDTLSTQRQIRGIDDIDDDDDDDELTSKTKSSTKTKSANCESRTRFTGDMSYVLDSLKQWKKLYRGLGASLLLTINPAIQYTVFEQSKRRVLFGLQKRSARKGKGNRAPKELSVGDAFVLGALSKAVATFLTYPLVRAKVLAKAPVTRGVNQGASVLFHGKSVPAVMSLVVQTEGPAGLYKGLNAQLVKTVLAAAFSLTVKEKSFRTAMVLVVLMKGCEG